ncbi:cyclic pyranopterin monophosphate synthase MoaC [Chryseolinea lacunae]|uniref:cyclic pyranopterin monophosphate synthase n=1 Tax=Chryseolinea lacunae TaxID=2801331 RepID=A0ABS1KTW8_9BACT|nr:cyclic pyranopterin monophosphate synthase MoaC [Chryseolinea lacunae]MBL0742763.1 cyclic pyranopterin monophosphate synthase MoaC [Chryseolinea lacunae]
MSKEQFTHIDSAGNPKMVDVSEKKVTVRTAKAQATVHVGPDILSHLTGDEIITKKGPVFQTAIIAGVMGAKQTSSLIPFCHPLGLEDCQIHIAVRDGKIVIDSSVTITAKTGVEMEALTAVTVAALTVYDMCKALSHDIVIQNISLMSKTGGKKDFNR